MKTKFQGFDALAFKEEAQAEIYDEIKDLTQAEQVTYFRDRAVTGPLGTWWSEISSKARSI